MRRRCAICAALLGLAGAVVAVSLMLHDHVRAAVLGLPTVVPNVGNGSDWANISPKSQPTLVSLLEKMNEIRAIFGEWPELAKLVGSLLPGPRTQA